MRSAYAVGLIVAGMCCLGVSGLRAQTFDAVSVKEAADSGNTGGGMQLLPSGDVRVRHLPARFLITIAHGIEPYQLANAPDWTRVTFYDVTARANASTTRAGALAMMRAMLADRFALTSHREMRQVQGFALVRTSTRALGPGLTPSIVNCEQQPGIPRCAQGEITINSMRGNGLPLANIIQLVASQIGAPIADETMLSGAFDVSLRWSSGTQSTDDAPVISTALQEQLGLRLVRREISIEVLVVDHIERPEPD
jgi:uncharacterized protein (TIGR03435 family)